MTENFLDNLAADRFEYHVGALFAYAKYRRLDGKLYIDKVETPEELRGTGVAGRLMQHVVDFAKEEGLEVIPVCSYAQAWLSRQNQPKEPKP